MNYSSKELRNIKNSLKYWDISQGQKECVKNLIKQAERVQELERQNKALGLEVDGWFNKANEIHESMLRQDKVIDKFRQQNKRYREAIKGAIGKFNYDYHQEGMAELRNVLEGESE